VSDCARDGEADVRAAAQARRREDDHMAEKIVSRHALNSSCQNSPGGRLVFISSKDRPTLE
jgi:hypothetical protein